MTNAGMNSTALWLMLLLGAYHGINPGMGWLFAVALGMQERRGSAVVKALLPLALGHALAIGTAVLAAAFLGMTLPLAAIRYLVGVLLIGLGCYSLIWHRHPRWVRMQVGFRDLTLWSFLLASAHGAGLMLLPILLSSRTVEAANQMSYHDHSAVLNDPHATVIATVVHTAGYLGITALLACIVYWKVGLGLLRKTWLNFDLVWGVALVAAGLCSLLV